MNCIVDAVTVTYGRKHNLGNYNSVHCEVTISASWPPDELLEFSGLDAALRELSAQAKEAVKREILAAMGRREEEAV